MMTLAAPRSALILIDLQSGILSLPTRPRSADAVLATCKTLAGRFRAAGALVVPVHVGWAADFADAPPGLTDQPARREPGSLPGGWSDLAEGVAEPGDLLITKHQWGAFTGTGLDLQLRRRGLDTVVIAGIATNFGVESTARHAWELGYNVVVVEDGCATTAPAEMHELAFTSVFTRIARVTSSHELALS